MQANERPEEVDLRLFEPAKCLAMGALPLGDAIIVAASFPGCKLNSSKHFSVG